MKRCRIGVVLLLSVLVLGLAAHTWTSKFHTGLARNAELAVTAALREDWKTARSLIRSTRDQWESRWPISASLTDHSPMEEIDLLFVQLEIYAALEDTGEFGAACAQLETRLEAMADAHGLQWWDLM